MSREKTNDEVRKEFMAWVVEGCVDAMRHPSRKEAVLHAVFRVLSTLEGSGDFPYCAVIPQPHPDAADYLRENHEDSDSAVPRGRARGSGPGTPSW